MQNIHTAVKAFGVKCRKSQLLILIAINNPELKNEELARLVGYSRSTLSSPEWQGKLIAARQGKLFPRAVDLSGKLLDSDTD